MRIRRVIIKKRQKSRRVYRKQRGRFFWKNSFWKKIFGLKKVVTRCNVFNVMSSITLKYLP